MAQVIWVQYNKTTGGHCYVKKKALKGGNDPTGTGQTKRKKEDKLQNIGKSRQVPTRK